jgi:hypothetical protein
LKKGDFCYTVFMQARFYANMRTVVGTSALDVDVREVDTFRKLVAFLVAKYPDAKFHLLDEQGTLRPDVPVYVDGRNPRLLKDGMTPRSLIRDQFSPFGVNECEVCVNRL